MKEPNLKVTFLVITATLARIELVCLIHLNCCLGHVDVGVEAFKVPVVQNDASKESCRLAQFTECMCVWLREHVIDPVEQILGMGITERVHADLVQG